MKKQSVQYTSRFSFHSMQAMAICSRNSSSCLNCEISRVLESWPFWCALLMHLCKPWHCDCSTRMRRVDTFCHLSLIYIYREDAWNVPVSKFFLNVVISLSLNDSAHNILNDVLKIYSLVGSLLFNGFSVFDGFLVSVILLRVISPTGGMVMCLSSSQPSKGCADLVFFWLLFDRILGFCHTFD